MTLRDKIFSQKIESKQEKYHWKYFDQDVLIRELSTTEVEDLAQTSYDIQRKKLKKSYTAAKIIASVFDPETGQPVFTKADLNYLSELPAAATFEISEKIEALNSPKAEDAEEALKN